MPAGIVALTVVILAVGCAPRAPTPGDLLIVGQIAEAQSLDPHVATSTNDFRILENIYEGLVRFADGTLNIQPALAKSWDISEDGLRYTFTLRRDVRFHDGTAFDAAAVRYNFERMLDPTHPEHTTGPFPLAFFFSVIETINTPDSHTVELILSEPFAPLLANLAYPTGYMVSPAAVRERQRDFGRNPSGTGPFKFADWKSHRWLRIERNPDYWGSPARLQSVVFRPLSDENARLTELLAGGCDIVVEAPPEILDFFRRREGYQVSEQAGPHLWFLILNTREGPFADDRMRRAVNYAIDRESIANELLRGAATPAAGPVAEAFGSAFTGDLSPYPHDPEKARELITEAGYTGSEIRLIATESGSGMLNPQAMAVAIQADLAEVGLKLEIEIFEWNTFLARVNAGLSGLGDMAQMAWMTNDPDTLPYLALRTEAWPESGGFNSGYYSNPKVDKLLERARRKTDPQARAPLYREVQRIVHEDAPWLFMVSWKQNAVARSQVRGFNLQPSFLLRLSGVYKDE